MWMFQPTWDTFSGIMMGASRSAGREAAPRSWNHGTKKSTFNETEKELQRTMSSCVPHVA